MIVEIAALCDAATDQGGRLNILGAFDRIIAPLPFICPQCSAVFRIRYQRSEAITNSFSLSITNLQEQNLIPPLESEITFPPLGDYFESGTINMILNMQRLHIAEEGKYMLRLRVNQMEIALLPLFVKDTTPHEPNPLAN